MIKGIFISIFTLVLVFRAHCFNSGHEVHIDQPFTYTIILHNVDYTNGFQWENGVKTGSTFKCPLYYVNSLGLITEICPDNGTSDTVTIYHTQDQLEMVHSIRGLNFFYYRLNAGDTLSLHYEDGIPIADSPVQNVYYNLIKDNPLAEMMARRYLEHDISNRVYKEFKSKNDIPLELENFKLFYQNLDSLYREIKRSHNYQINYVRNNASSPDYWEGILNKEMRRLVLISDYVDDSDTSLYGKELNFDVYSISDRFYYKYKFNQNPDSIFSSIGYNSSGINSELARYYFQLYLEKFTEGKTLESINNLISQYYNSFSQPRDTMFIHGLRTIMGVEESQAEDIKIRNAAGVETTLKQLIKQEGASVYYIDFWASWCAPCRKEIPYSIDLKKELEDMDVRFIYLAYNDRMANWIKAGEDLHLSDYKYSYFINNSRSSQQLMDYNIKTIPRYMILDKDGKVMVSNAKRPSDTTLKKMLLNTLK